MARKKGGRREYQRQHISIACNMGVYIHGVFVWASVSRVFCLSLPLCIYYPEGKRISRLFEVLANASSPMLGTVARRLLWC